MKLFLNVFALLLSIIFYTQSLAQAPNLQAVDNVLSQFHSSAAKADWDTYFQLMSADAIFMGTDATERWTKNEFEQYARKTNGWTYYLRERHINFTPDGNSAWFDELLWNEKLGLCRGSGVLIKSKDNKASGEQWLLSQYNLTIPIPNDAVSKVIPIIGAKKL